MGYPSPVTVSPAYAGKRALAREYLKGHPRNRLVPKAPKPFLLDLWRRKL